MKADLTRSTFRSEQHFRAVRMQQGRVQLDADWNEQQDLLNHRIETETRDTLGASAGPLAAPGFGLTGVGGNVEISAGHYYVDGLLCENPSVVTLNTQPSLPPDGTKLTDGIYLGYIEVWLRHITALEDPLLREVALGGPDTATRDQLLWQVKLLRAGDVGDPLSCLSDIPAYTARSAPPDGRLAARSAASTPPKDPCLLAPDAGYRRLENLLYRVEIHDDSSVSGHSRFKWSRDNACIVSQVVRWFGDPKSDELEVASVGRDGRMAITAGCWLELIDDTHELRGQSGALVQVLKTEGNVVTVDLTTKTGSLDKALYPSNPRVRRWEGLDKITPAAANSSSGWVELEDGVEIKFAPGAYRIGDFWQVPARTALGDIEWPLEAGKPKFQAPLGVLRAFARLGLLELSGGVFKTLFDCRSLFPALSQLTNLFYVGGDGQETTPDPLNPTDVALPSPLEVAVFNGQFPVVGAEVQFTASGGALSNGAGTGSKVTAITNARGLASVTWRLAPGVLDQTCKAELLEAGVPASGKYNQLHFSARLSRASEVSYDPAECADLKAQGVKTVQAALDALCKKSHGGCCATVGEGGEFTTLDSALQAAIDGKLRDVCLCLLVGDHKLGRGRFEFDDDTQISIHGAGAASRLFLSEQALTFSGAASLLLRDFDVIQQGSKALMRLGAQDRVTLSGVNVSGRTTERRSLVQIEGADLVQVSACTFHASAEKAPQRFRQLLTEAQLLEALAASFEETSLSAPISKRVVGRFMSFNQAERAAFGKQVTILRASRTLKLTADESDAFDTLLEALEPPANQRRIRAALSKLRDVLSISSDALALCLFDADGDTTLSDNRILGQLSLYGEVGESKDPGADKLAQQWKKRVRAVQRGGGHLRLRGNSIQQIKIGQPMLEQIAKLDPNGDRVLTGCYDAIIADTNTFKLGENQLLASNLGLFGNSFVPSSDAGVALGSEGKYIGNFSRNDVRLFVVDHEPAEFGNGALNIVVA